MSRRNALLVSSLSLYLLGQPWVAVAAAPPKPAARATKAAKNDAKQLVGAAKKALAATVKEAKKTGKLDPKNKKNAPFWSAVKALEADLSKLERGLAAKDAKALKALQTGSQKVSELGAIWPRTGVKSKGVDSGIAALGKSFGALRSGYGKESVRRAKGGGLSAAEKQQLEKMKAQQKRLAQQLEPLRAKAAKANDRRTERELARLIAESNRIAKAELALDAFLTALVLADALRGAWWGYSYYVDPAWRTDWVAIDVVVEEVFVVWDEVWVETIDVVEITDWSYLEVSVEIEWELEVEISDVEISTELDFVEESLEVSEVEWESYTESYGAELEAELGDEVIVESEESFELWEEESEEIEAEEEVEEEEVVTEEESSEEEDADSEDEGDEGDEEDAGDDEGDEDGDEEDDAGDEGDEDGGDEEDDAGDDEEDDADGDEEDDAGGDEEEDDGGGDEEEDDGGGDEEEDDGGGDEEEDDGGGDEEDEGGDEEEDDGGGEEDYGDEGGDDEGGDDEGYEDDGGGEEDYGDDGGDDGGYEDDGGGEEEGPDAV